MRNASRNLSQKKEEKWLEYQFAFSLSLAETTNFILPPLETFDVSI